MTCEIDINTDRVWQAGSYMLVGRRANFDALWNSINRLDSVLESLRAYDNASGTVTRNVDKAQQNLRKCRTQCIDVTTNAMVRTGNFLQDVAIEYEASERYVKSLWDDNYTHRSWSFTKDDLASLISQAGKLIAKDPLAFVATFAAECAEAFAKGWEKVSPYLDYVIDAVTAVGIIAFATTSPIGWVFLAGFCISTIYKYASNGGSILGDAAALGAELLGADKETIENVRSSLGFAQSVGELFLPGGGIAKAVGVGAKSISKVDKIARSVDAAYGLKKWGNTLINGGKFSSALRAPSETVAKKIFLKTVGVVDFNQRNCRVSKTSTKLLCNISGDYWTYKRTDMVFRGLRARDYSREASNFGSTLSEVKGSIDNGTNVYDYVTNKGENGGHNNLIADAWHRCFG